MTLESKIVELMREQSLFFDELEKNINSITPGIYEKIIADLKKIRLEFKAVIKSETEGKFRDLEKRALDIEAKFEVKIKEIHEQIEGIDDWIGKSSAFEEETKSQFPFGFSYSKVDFVCDGIVHSGIESDISKIRGQDNFSKKFSIYIKNPKFSGFQPYIPFCDYIFRSSEVITMKGDDKIKFSPGSRIIGATINCKKRLNDCFELAKPMNLEESRVSRENGFSRAFNSCVFYQQMSDYNNFSPEIGTNIFFIKNSD